MNKDIFQRCHTTYGCVQKLIRAAVYEVAGNQASEEMLEELTSEGWILAIEMLESYDPTRGCKVSTFLWQPLNWRLQRYYCAIIRKKDKETLQDDNSQDDNANMKLSTEAITNSSIEGNPYMMSPDIFYEKMERATLWKTLKNDFASKIELCLSASPPNADSSFRTRLWRTKQRELVKLKLSLQKLMM